MGTIEKVNRERSKSTYALNPEEMGFGVWIWYTVENRITWSAGFGRLLGLEEGVEPSFEVLIASIYPDDVRLFYNNLIVVLNDWQPRWCTFRICQDDKTVHTMKCLLEGMAIGCGEETDIVGVCFAM